MLSSQTFFGILSKVFTQAFLSHSIAAADIFHTKKPQEAVIFKICAFAFKMNSLFSYFMAFKPTNGQGPYAFLGKLERKILSKMDTKNRA